MLESYLPFVIVYQKGTPDACDSYRYAPVTDFCDNFLGASFKRKASCVYQLSVSEPQQTRWKCLKSFIQNLDQQQVRGPVELVLKNSYNYLPMNI